MGLWEERNLVLVALVEDVPVPPRIPLVLLCIGGKQHVNTETHQFSHRRGWFTEFSRLTFPEGSDEPPRAGGGRRGDPRGAELRLLLSRGHGARFKSAGTRRGGGGGLPGRLVAGALATVTSDDEPAGAGPGNLISETEMRPI